MPFIRKDSLLFWWPDNLHNSNAHFTESQASKWIAMDLDHTLITPKSGATFPKHAEDWTWSFPLDAFKKTLDNTGVVILTNQKGLKTAKQLNEFCNKWIEVYKELHTANVGVEWRLIASLGDDIYRKPAPGMWDIAEQDFGISLTMYVGDAAGRTNDHSAVDLMLALNVGKPFALPEVYLGLDERSRNHMSHLVSKLENSNLVFNPSRFLDENKTLQVELPQLNLDDIRLVVMVGAPGSGKSSFCSEYLSDWVHMSGDTWDSSASSFKKRVKELLQLGRRVVIDNTSASIKSRAIWVDLANKVGIKCVAIFMKITENRGYCEHMVTLRRILELQDVPVVALRSFYKRFEKVEKDEGFSEIYTIPLVLKFSNSLDGLTESRFRWWLN